MGEAKAEAARAEKATIPVKRILMIGLVLILKIVNPKSWKKA